ncbi:MAG TPA: ATP-binding cassette domain-containing protein [Mycobacteriales bacterium]|jgi:branched-chain amino acid transport system ATP-binding protein|nr:ATP-binding cassette domain-containing protein [Mycobacteriales bacterium]
MTIALALRDVRAGYGPVEVLHGVDLDVATGTLTALLGPNGAGKSTLLSVIAGLVPMSTGELVWDGLVISDLAPHLRAKAGLVHVPARGGVFPDLSVRDNLTVFAGSKRGWDAALEAFPILRERLSQRAGLLSGGEQQMLALSHALLRKPRLLLLDEISTGLAPRVTRTLFDVVTTMATAGTTVVLVEQHVSDALRMADVVYLLRHGEVALAGEPAEFTNLVQR